MVKYLTALLFFISINCAVSQPVISFDTIVTGLSNPVDIEEVNDSSHRLFIVEQTGQVRIWNGTALLPTPFIDVSSVITAGGERGLLNLAFHPNYINNGYFFIYYTDKNGSVAIARYSRSAADIANPASGVVLMTIPKPFANHNGGNLAFGPDGFLYFGTGDGGGAGDPNNNAQNSASLLGKMLRIDVNNPDPPYYSIPADNPFATSTEKRKEIIAIGLRNPWRWSFDKQTGDMWIADVGQDEWEEINYVKSGNRLDKNYGWKCLEGTHKYNSGCTELPNTVTPVFEYPHINATGGVSVTGGYVYRGNEFASFQGYYICTDFVSGNGWLIKPDGSNGWNTTIQRDWPAGISTFGERADGTLYAATLSGTLYKIVAGTALPLHLNSFTGRETGAKFEINWQVQNEETNNIYIIEKRTNISDPFTEVSRISAGRNTAINNYSVKVDLSSGVSYYRLKTVSTSGQISYSSVITANGINRQMVRAFITGTNLMLKLAAGTTSVELLDASGRSVLKKETDPASVTAHIPLIGISKGIITVRVLTDKEWQITRVLY